MKILSDYILFDDYDAAFSAAHELDVPVSIINNTGTHYFPCVDMAFEYSKAFIFGDNEICDEIEKTIDTSYMTSCHITQLNRIYRLGSIVSEFSKERWDKMKFELMYTIEFQRYFYNRLHMEKLFALPDKKLVYCGNAMDDWGCGFDVQHAMKWKNDWRKNHLGHVLEKVQQDIVKGLVWPTMHISLNKFFAINTFADNGQLKLDF